MDRRYVESNRNKKVPTPVAIRDRIKELREEIEQLQQTLSPDSIILDNFKQMNAKDDANERVDYSNYKNGDVIPVRKKLKLMRDEKNKPRRKKNNDDEDYVEGKQKASARKTKKREEESEDDATESEKEEESLEEEVIVTKRKTVHHSGTKQTNRQHRIEVLKKVTHTTPSPMKNKGEYKYYCLPIFICNK